MMLKKLKLAIAVCAADAFEWYDYALFSQYAVLIGDKFFPSDDSDVSLLKAFLVFGMGYVMRPLGGLFFGAMGDRVGRKASLNCALTCMAVPTVVVGLLPTYQDVGVVATVLILICRLLQGFSMGGAITGSVSLVIEHAAKKRLALAGSIPFFGICFGVLLGSLVANIVRLGFSTEQFELWAWRLPFIGGLAALFIGSYIKKHIAETPQFLAMSQSGCVERSPVLEAFRCHWFEMIVSAALNSIGPAVFYMITTYIPTFLIHNRGLEAGQVGYISMSCYVIMAFSCLATGMLADMYGYRKVFFWNIAATIVALPFALMAYDHGPVTAIIVAHVLMSVIASMSAGARIALQAALFPTNVRNTAMSISHNIANVVFGGTVPYILAVLVYKSGTIISCQWYFIACALLNIGALWVCGFAPTDYNKLSTLKITMITTSIKLKKQALIIWQKSRIKLD